MDFELSETQAMVRDTARAFSDRVLRPRAADFERAEHVPSDVLREMADLGLMGVNVPAALGGAEAGAVAYALAIAEIARGCSATAVIMAVTNMVAEVITKVGTDAQRAAHVTKITSGAYEAASFALSEPGAGSDPGAMQTTAVRREGRWVINGQKQWITNGDRAGVFVVWARTGGPGTAGLSAFLVEKGAPGLTLGKASARRRRCRSPSTTARCPTTPCSGPRAAASSLP